MSLRWERFFVQFCVFSTFGAFGVLPLGYYLWGTTFGVLPLGYYLWGTTFGVLPLWYYLWVLPLGYYLWELGYYLWGTTFGVHYLASWYYLALRYYFCSTPLGYLWGGFVFCRFVFNFCYQFGVIDHSVLCLKFKSPTYSNRRPFSISGKKGLSACTY
jgi:hypothetical protein